MARRSVETRSGPGTNPPRCGVWPSCLPQGRRCCHDDSASNVGPGRRLHDNPERAWTGIDPSDRFDAGRPRTRPGGRFGWGVRSMGPLAATEADGGRFGESGGGESEGSDAGGALPASAGPVRPCAGPSADRCLYRSWHAADQREPIEGDAHGLELVGESAAGVVVAGGSGVGDQAGAADRIYADQPGIEYAGLPHRDRPDPAARTAGGTAVPHYPLVGRGAEDRGGEL